MKPQVVLCTAALFTNAVSAGFFDNFWHKATTWGGLQSNPSKIPVNPDKSDLPSGISDDWTVIDVNTVSNLDKNEATDVILTARTVPVTKEVIQGAIKRLKENVSIKAKYEAAQKIKTMARGGGTAKTNVKPFEDIDFSVEFVFAGDQEAMKGRMCTKAISEAEQVVLGCDKPVGSEWTTAKDMKDIKVLIMRFQLDRGRFGTVTVETKLDGSRNFAAPVYNPVASKTSAKSFSLSEMSYDFGHALLLAKWAAPKEEIDFNFILLNDNLEEMNKKLKKCEFLPGQPYYQFGHKSEYRLQRKNSFPYRFVGAFNGCVNTDCLVNCDKKTK